MRFPAAALNALHLPAGSGRFGWLALCLLPVSPVNPESPLRTATAHQAPAEASALEWIGGDSHSFGIVISGEIIHHTFAFISSGDADLVIQELITDCACTTFEAFRIDSAGKRTPYEIESALPPGDTLELAVRINTSGKFGELYFNVRVKTNSPEMQYGAARSQLECVEAFKVDPTPLALGEMFPNQSLAGSMQITNIFAEPFRPEFDANPFGEWIQVELEAVEPDAEGLAKLWNVHVSASGDLPLKANDIYPIRLRATLPNKAQFASAKTDGVALFSFQPLVAITARKWIEFEPKQLEFGRLWAKRTYTRTLVIKNHDKEFELALTPADVSLQGYGKAFAWKSATEIELHALESGGYQVTVTVSGLPQRMKKPFQGYLSISTGHPSLPTFDVPLIGQHR